VPETRQIGIFPYRDEADRGEIARAARLAVTFEWALRKCARIVPPIFVGSPIEAWAVQGRAGAAQRRGPQNPSVITAAGAPIGCSR
jgi:hypothetical protein